MRPRGGAPALAAPLDGCRDEYGYQAALICEVGDAFKLRLTSEQPEIAQEREWI